MIKIENLYHKYCRNDLLEIETLKNINLKIKKGNFVSIIGSNGSGKSTLAKHLNGLIISQKGKIFIDNKEIKNDNTIWDIRKKVGMIFQNPDNQFIGGTVEEDIAFGLENICVPSEKMKEIIFKSLEKVGMEKFLKKPPHRLSGGQKQRIAIASIIAMNPEYLILDEPTSMLDPKGRKEIFNIMYHLNKNENITIILITHFIEEVIYSDKIIVMNKGEKFLEGTPEKIFKNNKKKLLKIGFNLPYVMDLSISLIEQGIPLKNLILTKEDLVKELCQLN